MKLMNTAALAVLVGAVSVTAAQAQMRFQGMDRNHDGVITRDEWRGSDQSFRNQDWNHDGVLSGDEVHPGAQRDNRDSDRNDRTSRQWGVGGPRNDFSAIDRNNDGWISRNEWNMPDSYFNSLDTNRDNRISRYEFQSAAGTSRSYQGRNSARQAGYDRGLSEGRQAGHEDKANGHGWDLLGQTELEQANSGYQSGYGSLGDYQSGYRDGFRLGYRQGFNDR